MQQNKRRIKIKESNNYGLDRVSMIAEFDGNEEELFKLDLGNVLPVLPLRNMVLFPTAVLPVSVGRESSLQLVREMQEKKGYFAVVCQKDPKLEEPTYKDIYPTGTIAKVIKVFEMPDGHVTALLQGMQRVKVKRFTRTAPYIRGSVERLEEILPAKNDTEYKTILEDCRDTVGKIISEEISNAPIIFIPITIVVAVSAAMSILYAEAFVPVAFAKFSSNVTAKISW